MTSTIRVAIGQFNELSHERLTFAQQIGASGVLLNTPTLPGEQRWETSDLQWLRRRCDQYGLRLQFAGHYHPGDVVEIVEGDVAAHSFVAVYRREGRPVAVLGIGQPKVFGRWRKQLATDASA